MKQEDLLAFDDCLSKTASPKEQKQHMRSLLLLATGNKLKALASQKTTNIITNVTSEQTESHDFHFYCIIFDESIILSVHCEKQHLFFFSFVVFSLLLLRVGLMELFSVSTDISVSSIFHSSIYTKHFLSPTRFACGAMVCC